MAGARDRGAVSAELDALLGVIRVLEELEIPHMVTGSVASSFHGRPRATHDADIVIDPTPATLDRLVSALTSGGFYLDADLARDALRRRLQFNAIETESAFKIDLIIRKDRPFSREELRRRQIVELSPKARAAVASPEDTVLSKLEWAKRAGGSERQLQDAAGVLAVNRDLDVSYIEEWAGKLGVIDLWREILAESPEEP
jgi:hypothetical protein